MTNQLRAAALGVCEFCGGPLTEIWSAGSGSVTVVVSDGTAPAVTGGGGGGVYPPSEPPSESWKFCSRAHLDAFLAARPQA